MKTKLERGIEVVDVSIPKVKPGMALIKVKAAGICGSDLHFYNATETGPALPYVPYILGHEGAGDVVEVGKEVESVKVGDRVTYNPFVSKRNQFCGKCHFCMSAQPLGCPNRKLTSEGGCMAEYQLIQADALFKLPEGISYEVGALIEPFAVSYHGVLEVSSLKTSDVIVIQGSGTIGLLAIIAAKLITPSRIIMTGTEADKAVRFKLAEELGVDILINVVKDDPIKKVMELTGGVGVDLVFDTTGVPLLQEGVKMLRFGGEYMAIGHPEGTKPVPLNAVDYNDIIRRRKKIIGSWIYDTQTWMRVIKLLENRKVRIDSIITHRLPITEALKGFELGFDKKCVKVILKP